MAQFPIRSSAISTDLALLFMYYVYSNIRWAPPLPSRITVQNWGCGNQIVPRQGRLIVTIKEGLHVVIVKHNLIRRSISDFIFFFHHVALNLGGLRRLGTNVYSDLCSTLVRWVPGICPIRRIYAHPSKGNRQHSQYVGSSETLLWH